MTTRAKFRCARENNVRFGLNHDPQREYEFTAVYDDGTPENQRYALSTPVGSLKITVTNPAVEFVPGRCYYLDISEVPEP